MALRFHVVVLTGDRNVTLASKRKMSSRQKSTRSSRFTQTDECSSSSTRSSPNFNGTSSESMDGASPILNSTVRGMNGECDDDQSVFFDKRTKAEQVGWTLISICFHNTC